MNERLEHLRQLGAEGFDPPAFKFVAALLERAAGFSGAAAARLEHRAISRLEALERALLAARAEAVVLMERLHALGDEAAAARATLDLAFATGDFGQVLREAPRVLRSAASARGGAGDETRSRIGRLLDDANRRGVMLPSELEAAALAALHAESATTDLTAQSLAEQVAAALYRDAVQDTRATLLVARAQDRLSDDFGPYNAQALAARTLAQLEATSPAFLRHYLAELADLSALRILPEPKRK